MVTYKVLLFLIKNFFSEKLVLVQKREHNFRILAFLVLPTFFIPPLPLSLILFFMPVLLILVLVLEVSAEKDFR